MIDFKDGDFVKVKPEKYGYHLDWVANAIFYVKEISVASSIKACYLYLPSMAIKTGRFSPPSHFERVYPKLR